MALSGTDRGTYDDTVSDTTTAVSPASNFTPGALAVLCASWNNSESGGSDPFSSIVDNLGNTWTRRTTALYDPGAANAGIVGGIFTCPQDVAPITTSTVITLTFSTNVAASSGTFREMASDAGLVEFVTGDVNAGANTDTPTVTTSSIASGHAVVGALHAEINLSSLTGDADTSNGSWSAAQKNGTGVGAAAAATLSQYKVTTGTATQTFNPTLTAADCILSWIELQEVVVAFRAPKPLAILQAVNRASRF